MSNQYRQMLSRIDEALSEPPGDDWASMVNHRGLENLRNEVSEALLKEQRRVRLRMMRGVVLGNAAPAHLALRLVSEFNEAVVEAANRHLLRPYRNITDDVRSKLGLYALPPTAGSFAIELAAPTPTDARVTRSAELEAASEEIPGIGSESVVSRALADVLDVLETSTIAGMRADEIAAKVTNVGLGGARHLSRMAARAEVGDLAVEFSARSNRGDTGTFVFTASHAAWLRSVIKNRDLDVSRVTVLGTLSTASTIRSLFDIVDDDGKRVSGSVEKSVRPAVSALYTQRVRAIIEERLDPRDPSGESMSRTLIEIAPEEVAEQEPLS
ncbi:MAG: hypothetical protein PGN15_04620 [Aeromicrobium erythreum]